MNISSNLILPAGCTASLIMEFKPRNYYPGGVAQNGTGCSNSGMDGSDGMSITNSGGIISSQGSTVVTNNSPTCAAYPALATYTTNTALISTGCSNASGTVAMVVNGGTCTINGISNRGDEIVTYTINLSGAACGASCGLVLPIELMDFSAENKGANIRLSWMVSSELNLDYYLVEKSIDAINWKPLVKVHPQNSGKTDYKHYQTEDDSPLSGINYYRLTNFDNDGSNKTHKIVSVSYLKKSNSFWFTQNEEELTIHLAGVITNGTLNLYDVSGRLVKKIKIADNAGLTINKRDLPRGLLLLGCEELPQLGMVKVLIY